MMPTPSVLFLERVRVLAALQEQGCLVWRLASERDHFDLDPSKD